MENIEKRRKQEKNFAYVLTVLFLLIGAWFVKQNAKINKENETGIKQPMDTFDKVGYLIVLCLITLLVVGIIIGSILGFCDFFMSNRISK